MQIPVAEGSAASLTGIMKNVASFVHGDDGFGNTNQRIVQVQHSHTSDHFPVYEARSSDQHHKCRHA